MEERRLAILQISPEFFSNMFSGVNFRRPSWAVTKNALPDDARLISVTYPESWPQCIYVVFWSASFDIVPIEDKIPTLPPVEMTAYYDAYNFSGALPVPFSDTPILVGEST